MKMGRAREHAHVWRRLRRPIVRVVALMPHGTPILVKSVFSNARQQFSCCSLLGPKGLKHFVLRCRHYMSARASQVSAKRARQAVAVPLRARVFAGVAVYACNGMRWDVCDRFLSSRLMPFAQHSHAVANRGGGWRGWVAGVVNGVCQ